MMRSKPQKHPIQLLEITVHKLDLTVNDSSIARNFIGELTLDIELGLSDYSEKNPHLSIGLKVKTEPSIPNEKDSPKPIEPPFSVSVELRGHFEIDYSNFNIDYIKEWSEINAPYILLPYVREQVYGLALRAGIKGLIFPLFIQPNALPYK